MKSSYELRMLLRNLHFLTSVSVKGMSKKSAIYSNLETQSSKLKTWFLWSMPECIIESHIVVLT